MLEGGETPWPRGRGAERFVISSAALSGVGALDAIAAFLADAVIVSKFGLQAGTDAFFAAAPFAAAFVVVRVDLAISSFFRRDFGGRAPEGAGL